MINKKRYKAIINGRQYTIIGEETKEHFDLVTQMINEHIKIIKDKVKDASEEQLAVLLSINLMSDLLKKQEENIVLVNEKIDNFSLIEEANEKIEDLETELKRYQEAQLASKQLPDQLTSELEKSSTIGENDKKTKLHILNKV